MKLKRMQPITPKNGDPTCTLPGGPVLAIVEHHGHELLHRCLGGGARSVRTADIFNTDQAAILILARVG